MTSAGWAIWPSAGGGARFDVVALQVAGAGDTVGISVVALLSIVDNSITASWLLAVGSAFVGLVAIVVTLVALFSSLNLAVSANGSGCGGPRHLSAIQRLNRTGIGSTNGSLEDLQLLNGDGLGFGQNVPGHFLSARGSSKGTRIFGNWGGLVAKDRGQ